VGWESESVPNKEKEGREGGKSHGQRTIMNTKPHEFGFANMEGKDTKNTNREEDQESKQQRIRLHCRSRSDQD
jgi:hypothetical protein